MSNQSYFSSSIKKFQYLNANIRETVKPSYYAVLYFIAERTIQWNKDWEVITLKQMINGMWSSKGTKIAGAVGYQERTI